ncbi:MAG: DMT family transporter [Roseiflexaceae bacterium]
MKATDVGRLLLLAGLWGGSFLFMRIAAPVIGPAWVAFGRSGIAAILLLSYAGVRRTDLHFRSYKWNYVVLGAFQSAIPFFLFAYAETILSASLGAIINATSPLFGLLIGVLLRDEKLTWQNLLGIFIGIAGVSIVVGYDDTQVSMTVIRAVLMAFGAACSYGISSNYTRRYVKGAPALGMAAYSQLFAALMLSPLLLLFPPIAPITTDAISAMLLLGVLATGFAYILFFRLVVDVGPVVSLTVTFLVPVTALIWGIVLLGEEIRLAQYVGSIVVLIGTALTTGVFQRISKRFSAQQA